MYINDTNMLHMENFPSAYNEELIRQVENSTMDWAMAGQATGGCFQPEEISGVFSDIQVCKGEAAYEKAKGASHSHRPCCNRG